MASTITLTVDHELGREEALRRLRARCDQAERRHAIAFLHPETAWTNGGCVFGLTALGHVFRGQLAMHDHGAVLSLEIPRVARPLSERLASLIGEEGRRLLAAAPNGQATPAVEAPSFRPRGRRDAGATDAVIGVAADYGWDDIRVWANSLVESGFAGDRIVIATGVEPAALARLRRAGFTIVVPKPADRLRDGRGALPIVVERFFLIQDLLKTSRHRFVVLTDVRDVVFQCNPSAWLEDNARQTGLVASSEGLRLGDEWWGGFILSQAFGAHALRAMRRKESFNAGVIAGTSEQCRRVCRDIIRLTTGRDVRNADQAAYNLLLHSPSWRAQVRPVRHDEPWACQSGTVADPIQLPQLRPKLIDVQPRFDGAAVTTPAGEPYAIVHQYDRVPDWMVYFGRKFAERRPSAHGSEPAARRGR